MITIESRFFVEGLTGQKVFGLLLEAADEEYRRWWPGTHLRLHALERGHDHVGDAFYMDEYVGPPSASPTPRFARSSTHGTWVSLRPTRSARQHRPDGGLS